MINPGWTLHHAQLHRTIRQRQLLQKRQRILVAVSGGQDSLCLARLLLDLQPKWQWDLAIAHCNHRWRPDADANADYVESLACLWQVPYYAAVAESIPTGEAAARQWRYEELCAIAQTHSYSAVTTGHTASDRAETTLYNLLRGSGIDGLQALTWQRNLASNVSLVRPLLEWTRTETGQFCQDRHLRVWEDSTNQSLQYTRNRIRLELLPYLQTHFNPQVERTLAQTAELLRAEVEYLEEAATMLRSQAVTSPADNTLPQINRRLLQSSPLALQRRVMRQVLLALLPEAPTFEQVEKLVSLIDAPNRSQTDPFPGGAIATVTGDWILLKQTLKTHSKH